MTEIKLITDKTDLSILNIEKMGWDTWHNDRPVDVYRIEGYVHSIGGHWGENNYWCCVRNLTPTNSNLMEFNGHPCQWGYNIEANNYYKYKYNQASIEGNYSIKILRNGFPFYSFIARDLDWGINRARMLLFNINEHPVNFNMIDYQKEIIGREIMWHKVPCIIASYSLDNSLKIYPDLRYTTKERFFECITNCDEEDRGNGFIMEDLFAESIEWFSLYINGGGA
ncbi:MAG: hypothetical protein JXB50_08115 [Spirochaetes bacterium]|nr:hypothetical protein [Spirochaetota bacterium]